MKAALEVQHRGTRIPTRAVWKGAYQQLRTNLGILEWSILVHDSATPLKVLSLRGAEETLSEPQAMLYGNALPVG